MTYLGMLGFPKRLLIGPDMSRKELAQDALAFHVPRYNELPNIPLYLDQVLDVVSSSLAYLGHGPLTKPMISNYIKNGALASPEKKRYSRSHLCYLIIIDILKPVYTLQQITSLIEIQQSTYSLEVAYDYFCTEFENALAEAFQFTGNPLPSVETKRTEQTILVRSLALSAANRVFVEKAFL